MFFFRNAINPLVEFAPASLLPTAGQAEALFRQQNASDEGEWLLGELPGLSLKMCRYYCGELDFTGYELDEYGAPIDDPWLERNYPSIPDYYYQLEFYASTQKTLSPLERAAKKATAQCSKAWLQAYWVEVCKQADIEVSYGSVDTRTRGIEYSIACDDYPTFLKCVTQIGVSTRELARQTPVSQRTRRALLAALRHSSGV
ncbi:hypothetical protein [Citrobacter rodentium]|nr:hypothetical protein [Citrobacter rodentium]KIQ49198.1 hypothetical protein TA05_22410 [Citrobacter rodentium]QBY30079.1 hypothetical protein E2R62_15315 [Citrobacter rodentium]UHO32539.1 hypothetical protein K7R23_07775 [Citrobacter rodentium NBRC 105723 = DSM 16636]HAT8015711.1 hypothetical protein [Citrobacter rodentium NBRC 105723 = DSM 16636]HAT8020547.1 hypothetical protein [Citrobacter rodentium]